MTHFRARTPKGDGNALRYELCYIEEHFRTRTPKGDGNRAWGRRERRSHYFISEHEPRKGTETPSRTSLGRASRISEHEPRKGTETRASDGISSHRGYFRTRTPKGDGNNKGILCSTCSGTLFQNTNPERGRKLHNPTMKHWLNT